MIVHAEKQTMGSAAETLTPVPVLSIEADDTSPSDGTQKTSRPSYEVAYGVFMRLRYDTVEVLPHDDLVDEFESELELPDGSTVGRDQEDEEQRHDEFWQHIVCSPSASSCEPDHCHVVLGTQSDKLEFVSRVERLKELGWEVRWSSDRALSIVSANDWYVDAQPVGRNDWFDLELGVAVGGRRHNLLPILLTYLEQHPNALMQKDSTEFVELPLDDTTTVRLERARLEGFRSILMELTASGLTDKRLRVGRFAAHALGDVSNSETMPFRDWVKRLRNFESLPEVDLPAHVDALLRPYQRDGVRWLKFLHEYDLHGILADDMGLGKTLQVLTFIDVLVREGHGSRPHLVLAPASVVHHWVQQAKQFFPDMKVVAHHAETRLGSVEEANRYHLVVSSYGLAQRGDSVVLENDWGVLALDEGQYIKNPRTKIHSVVCRLSAQRRLCMSGTPVENHLGELWSQFAFLLPGLLFGATQFRKVFRTPIERDADEEAMKLLKQRVRPFILRRRKEEVAQELPERTVVTERVNLLPEQLDVYEAIRISMQDRVRQLLARQGLRRSSIQVIDALLRLRQVCCHPALLPGREVSDGLRSAKLDRLFDMLLELDSEGRSVLVFSQFTSMLELIKDGLKERKVSHLMLTGKTRHRERLVKQFQDGEARVFLISLKAGGTGLDLTRADTVIHYDPWWNPAVEQQATDRAHRIGQTKQVFVYRLLCRDTVEEKIDLMQQKKGLLADTVLDGAGLAKLSEEDVLSLFDSPAIAETP